MQVILSALSNFKNDWIFFKGDIGGLHLVDLIIMELKSPMTCYNSNPLIGNYSIHTGEQIL